MEPLAGKLTYWIFAIGVIGTGFLAIPVLAGSLSYIVAETFNIKEGLDKKFHQAKGFYITIIISLVVGLLLHFLGVSPVKALLYTAILYGLTSPILIAIILHIGNNNPLILFNKKIKCQKKKKKYMKVNGTHIPPCAMH